MICDTDRLRFKCISDTGTDTAEQMYHDTWYVKQ